jgi:hypothetical protein
MQGDNQVNKPPEELDGAKVIKWAWSGSKPFGFLRYEGDLYDPIEIYGLAICRYDNSDNVCRLVVTRTGKCNRTECMNLLTMH